MGQVLTTDTVAAGQRLAYWVDMICSTYVQLECDARAAGPFDGAIESHRMPGLDLSVVTASAQDVLRTRRHLAQADDDCFLVSIQARGHGRIEQDGRTALLAPGDFALYDSTREYGLHFDDGFQQIVLKLPGERLRNLVRDTDKLTATAVSGKAGAGHLMINMIDTLWRDMDTLQPASAAAVADGVMNILLAGLQTLPASHCPGLSSLATYHLGRIKQVIATRLADPAFGVNDLARELGMSVAHIHRLFKNEATTPAQYIWGRRLEACSRDLLDARMAHRAISDIAFSWGFNDAAHFSRAFKERFGQGPRAWRMQRKLLPN
ncbi:helix-turn-helix domain-containing protein [Caenimonas sedimenti]|uniref:Helix-turn-helix domain-containing protein n=1 Tax=Caenimonas sedimenti TaxID=2596921 RepID=A0A562ZWJ9_9BURK|nr:helix-turn-helix domain-containing protein [Caenimonas sedimenti]TWO72756.1 helix-turn-helix domain-containing protein [Caenimonas sedimenti]